MGQSLEKQKGGFSRDRRFQELPIASPRPPAVRTLRAPWALILRVYRFLIKKNRIPLRVRIATRIGRVMDWSIDSTYKLLFYLVVALHGITATYGVTLSIISGALRSPFPEDSSLPAGVDLPFFSSPGDHHKIFSYEGSSLEKDRSSVDRILARSTRRSLGSTESEELAQAIVSESHKQRVDPVFVATLIRHESGFRRSVVSSAGAIGLMQILPSTGRFVCGLRQTSWSGSQRLCSPAYNLQLGITYLKYLLKQFPHNLSHMLIAYNWGPGNLQRALKHRRTIPRGPIGYARSILREYEKARGMKSVEVVSVISPKKSQISQQKKSIKKAPIKRAEQLVF